jgi:predicted dehydrogenase
MKESTDSAVKQTKDQSRSRAAAFGIRRAPNARVKVAVIGCGNISNAYFVGCKPFDLLEVVACADLEPSRAEAKAREHKVRACTVDELLGDPDIRIVVNLTIPAAHADVNLAIIRAGKHPYCEKPLAVTREDGRITLAAAKRKRARVGCAPDTFLGGGIQTCRKLIDDGAIGKPVAATAFMVCHGHESWHPSPEFYYKAGGGPMLDMGPYYLTALVNLLGPIKRVTGSTRITFPERIITSQPLHGTRIRVETPTHYSATMDFASGAIGTFVASFDVWSHNLPILEIYGTEGTLCVPDPNSFGGSVRVRRSHDKKWTEVPLTHSAEVGRGIGVADMAYGITYGRPHRASGELAFHVLDVMCSFEEASRRGRHIDIQSTCARPVPLPVGLPRGKLD